MSTSRNWTPVPASSNVSCAMGQPHGECAPAGPQQQVPGYQQRRNDHDDQVSVRGRPGDADICPERPEPEPRQEQRDQDDEAGGSHGLIRPAEPPQVEAEIAGRARHRRGVLPGPGAGDVLVTRRPGELAGRRAGPVGLAGMLVSLRCPAVAAEGCAQHGLRPALRAGHRRHPRSPAIRRPDISATAVKSPNVVLLSILDNFAHSLAGEQ